MKLNYKYSNIKFEKNTVIIAGAGPGSKKLHTRLKYILKLADVIVYDALVNESILDECKEKVLLVYAEKQKIHVAIRN